MVQPFCEPEGAKGLLGADSWHLRSQGWVGEEKVVNVHSSEATMLRKARRQEQPQDEQVGVVVWSLEDEVVAAWYRCAYSV